MAEIVSERTRTSKRFDEGGGTRRVVASIGSIHYESGGQWHEVDAEFVPSVAPWDWEMSGAGYGVRVKEDITAGQVAEFSKAGASVTLQPMSLQWTNDLDQIQQVATPQPEAALVTNPVVDLLPRVGVSSHLGTIRWDDAYGDGIDLQWQCTPSRLAKILEVESLAKLPVPQQFIIDGGNPVLRLSFIFDPSNDVDIYIDGQEWDRQSTMQTFTEIEFRKNGEILWTFAPLMYWDAAGTTGQSMATVRKTGNSLYVDVRVPYTWLQAAVFPVYVDVDVDEQVGAGTDDGHTVVVAGSPVSIQLATSPIVMGSGGATQFWGGMRWTGINIPAGATIDDCTIDIYPSNVDDPDNDIYFEKANNPVTFNGGDTSDMANRSRTTAKVNWTAANIGFAWNTSPELKTVLQEVVDSQSGTGDALVSLWWNPDSGSDLDARSYEFAGNAHGPKLDLTYTPGATSTPSGSSNPAVAVLNGDI
jgi:hypothetical protein